MAEDHIIETADEAATHRAGVLLGSSSHADDVIALIGGLGAGKTALVQGIAAGLGVTEHVPSPTFNILLVHVGDRTLYHFDLYRLDRADQLEDIDFYETVESGGVSAIEWADRFEDELPPDHLVVNIEVLDATRRRIVFRGCGPASELLARRWADAWAGGVAS
ncbi:MAG: tRNA (adenosine(37)-N6)-threonylcarbamoyltransferase complex ATPase subunit type 1 TsaE [Coriobacteriia bacterium]|nr:tRNA (adenosine(37)-N6)-threonylcarbamoyltransferase complex ATPase subunit type 1 TsaE [Coriobacteriia bacterium]